MPYYRSGKQKPLEAGNGIDITNETISLKQMSTSQFGGAKIDGTSITVNSNGQIKRLKTQTVTLSANTSKVNVGSTDMITATASAGGTLSASSSDTSIATASVSNGEVTITGVGEGNCVITVTASATGDYGVGTATIDTTVEAVHIFGAEWDGSSSPAWTRTDGAVGFADPNPYYAGMTGTPSSPFDSIMPWSGMRIVEDASAGTLVEIPKFYYKWTRNGSAMKLQISDIEQTESGWYVSPAHADRNDDVGERDYIYVGRYHCSSDSNHTYKSVTGDIPKGSISRATARTNIHNLGNNIWQWDFATYWTICMLYLVEFANWDSQAKIGYGCGDNSTRGYMGYTDSMPYHTGTTQTSRTTYGLSIQYRYIEGLWDNVCDWCDGIVFSSSYMQCFKNPSQFSDTYNATGSTYVGPRATSSNCIASWTSPSVIGFEYALYPSTLTNDSTYSTYVCDHYTYYSVGPVLCVGGGFIQNRSYGLFYLNGEHYASDEYGNVGSRLMVLPPSRLSPPTN